jgi:16S rRNA (guanine527-N7)-methyltransferase
MSGDLQHHITRRGSQAGLPVDDALADKLAAYVEVLARWNRKMNLTALPVDPPTDDAIDRLLIEPLVAAVWIEPRDRFAIDVGSGGGSPGIPIKIAMPALRMILVESRLKKAAFLREAIRHLELSEIQVENCRLEELVPRTDLQGCVDLVTVRAVSAEVELRGSIRKLLRPGGRVFWFGGRPAPPASLVTVPDFVGAASVETIPTPPRSHLTILRF